MMRFPSISARLLIAIRSVSPTGEEGRDYADHAHGHDREESSQEIFFDYFTLLFEQSEHGFRLRRLNIPIIGETGGRGNLNQDLPPARLPRRAQPRPGLGDKFQRE